MIKALSGGKGIEAQRGENGTIVLKCYHKDGTTSRLQIPAGVALEIFAGPDPMEFRASEDGVDFLTGSIEHIVQVTIPPHAIKVKAKELREEIKKIFAT